MTNLPGFLDLCGWKGVEEQAWSVRDQVVHDEGDLFPIVEVPSDLLAAEECDLGERVILKKRPRVPAGLTPMRHLQGRRGDSLYSGVNDSECTDRIPPGERLRLAG